MSDDFEQASTARRRPVWPPPKRGLAVVAPIAVVVEPSFKILQRGSAGLLDAPRWAKWEGTLNGHELDQWRKMKAILLTAGPEFRAAAMSIIVEQQIDHARKGRSDADEAGEKFRRDLIDRNIPSFKQQVENLDSAFTAMVARIEDLDKASSAVSDQARVLETALVAVQGQATQIQKVASPWHGTQPGAEWGRGISGYDTPKGVEQVGQEVAASMARRAAKHEPKAEESAVKPTTKPTHGLFGAT